MIEADFPNDAASDAEPRRRRSTFTPPSQESEVPLNLGESAQAVAQPSPGSADHDGQPAPAQPMNTEPPAPATPPAVPAQQPGNPPPPVAQPATGQPAQPPIPPASTGTPPGVTPPSVDPSGAPMTAQPPAPAPSAGTPQWPGNTVTNGPGPGGQLESPASPPQWSTPQPSMPSPTQSGWDESVLLPPERRSLSDQEIMAQMGGAGSDTGALIAALQEQMELRRREDAEFDSWQALIRQSYPEDEAIDIVVQGRARFEGIPVDQVPRPEATVVAAEPNVADPGVAEPHPPTADVSSPPVEPSATGEGVSVGSDTSEAFGSVPTAPVVDGAATSGAQPVDAAVSEPVAGDSPDNPTEATEVTEDQVADSVEDPEPAQSEPIVLPRFGQAQETLAVDGVGENVDEDQDDPDRLATGSFEKVLVDPDAVTPPTDAWPLAGFLTHPADSTSDDAAGVAESEQEWVEQVVAVESVTVTQDDQSVSVTVEAEQTVSIREALATKPQPEIPLENLEPQVAKRFGFDHVGIEPTPDNLRSDRVSQLLWAWWALGTPLPLVLVGVWLVETGLNVSQAILATTIGALIAALPLVIGTLQGSRSGLPTLISSRAAYGIAGNVIPATFMVVVRLAVATLVIWSAAWFATGVLVESNYWNGEPALIQVILAAVFALGAAGIAIAGRGVITIGLWVAAGLGVFGVIGVFLVGLEPLSTQAFSLPGASTSVVLAGVATVLSILLVFWAHFGGDIARFQSASGGAGGPSLAAVAAVIPVVGIVAWGALLGASGDSLRQALLADIFDTLLADAPLWYPIPAIVVGTLPLIAIGGLAVHSSGYAVASLGMKVPRYAAATIAGGLVALGVIGLVVFAPDMGGSLIDFALLAGVAVGAFVGGYTGEVLTRRVHLDPRLLVATSGSFPGFRVAPVLGFVASLGLGWGLITVDTAWMSFVGYLVGPLGQLGLVDLGGWQLGPLVALVLSLIVSLFAGIRGGVSISKRSSGGQ